MKLEIMQAKPIEYPNGDKPCKGLFFRAYRSVFWNGEKLEERSGYRFLKRKSCLGCETCENIFDEIKEESYGLQKNGIYQDNFTPGEIYQAGIQITSTDFETGCPDDWEVQFNLCKEAK